MNAEQMARLDGFLAAFARAFLNHVNPHTGRRYADEPAMPLLAMINEGSIGYVVQEARDTPAMQDAWAAWLKAKRAKDPAFGDIPEQIPHGMSGKAGSGSGNRGTGAVIGGVVGGAAGAVAGDQLHDKKK